MIIFQVSESLISSRFILGIILQILQLNQPQSHKFRNLYQNLKLIWIFSPKYQNYNPNPNLIKIFTDNNQFSSSVIIQNYPMVSESNSQQEINFNSYFS